MVGEAEVMTHQLIDQNAFCTKDSLKTANGRLTWILHLHIMVRFIYIYICLYRFFQIFSRFFFFRFQVDEKVSYFNITIKIDLFYSKIILCYA